MKPGRSNIPETFRPVHPGRQSPPGTSGLALIELLVVLALVMVMATLLWLPRSGKQGQKSLTLCRKNLQMLFTSLEIYAQDHRGSYPDHPGARSSEEPLQLLVPRYASDTRLFLCPGEPNPPGSIADALTNGRIGYAYFMGLKTGAQDRPLLADATVFTNSAAPGEVGFAAPRQGKGRHGVSGGNVLLGNGGLATFPAAATWPIRPAPQQILLNPK